MMKKIFIPCFAALIAFSNPTLAQTNEVVQLNARIAQLENQIQTLSRAVFRGDVKASDFSAPPAGGTGVSASAFTELDIKINQLESQIQQMTGALEEQQYKIDQLTRQLESGAAMPSNTATTMAQPTVTQPLDLTTDELTTTPTINNTNTTLAAGTNPDELYEKSFVDIRDGNYDAAEAGFKVFMANYPDHKLASNAQYWLAETYYVRANYTEAAKLFAQGYQDYPDSSKAADNLLKLGLSLGKLGNTEDACLSFQQLKTQFPDETGPVMRRTDQEIKNLNCE